MEVLSHLLTFGLSAAVVWFFAGLLINAVDRVARSLHKTGFTVAFFALGLLTSISEFSVLVNSSIDLVPQISAGNLAGASLVILFFIIPVLAISGDGIHLSRALTNRNLLMSLLVILAPLLLLVDGTLSLRDSILLLMISITLVYFISTQEASPGRSLKAVEKKLITKKASSWPELLKIFFGAVFIFGAGHFMVEEVSYFATYFSVPGSLIALIILSIGTNIPELSIALRALMKNRKDIAFGDYLGSAATNTLLFGILGITNGTFSVEPKEFIGTAIILFIGLICFYHFSRSKNRISRQEGLLLLVFYVLFLIVQFWNFAEFTMN